MTLSIADRLALADLVHRYPDAVDARRFDEVADLFTADGELLVPDPPAELGPVLAHRGRAQVTAALGALAGLTRTHHSITGEVYRADGPDRATGAVTGVAHHWRADAGEITDLVWYLRYADRYRRTDAGWRIARRELTIDAIETGTARRVRGLGR